MSIEKLKMSIEKLKKGTTAHALRVVRLDLVAMLEKFDGSEHHRSIAFSKCITFAKAFRRVGFVLKKPVPWYLLANAYLVAADLVTDQPRETLLETMDKLIADKERAEVAAALAALKTDGADAKQQKVAQPQKAAEQRQTFDA